MALMEDTGWYLPNYDMAEPLKWGAGLGCDFALKSCKEWMDDRTRKRMSIHPYCNKVGRVLNTHLATDNVPTSNKN